MRRNISIDTTTSTPFMYQTETLDAFSIWYSQWHGYISLLICSFGIPLNIFNITVLTQKKMQTPINCILTWLAVSDIATMASYVPFAIHFYCQYSANSISADKNSWSWMHFLLVYLNFSATAHTISIWLGVALAIFRHHHLQSPAKGNLTRIRRLIRARLVVFIILIGSILVMVPNYLSHRLIEVNLGKNSTGYIFERWELGSGRERPIILVGLFLYSILAKLVPCVLIIVYGSLLLITLNNTIRNKRRRLNENGVCLGSQRHASRTTVMLLIVMILFLITELPQAVLIMCCIFFKDFFEKVYIPLGDAMDIIALVNSSINFVLYCSMSQEFRRTFIKLFCTCSDAMLRRQPKSYISTQLRNNELHATYSETQRSL